MATEAGVRTWRDKVITYQGKHIPLNALRNMRVSHPELWELYKSRAIVKARQKLVARAVRKSVDAGERMYIRLKSSIDSKKVKDGGKRLHLINMRKGHYDPSDIGPTTILDALRGGTAEGFRKNPNYLDLLTSGCYKEKHISLEVPLEEEQDIVDILGKIAGIYKR